MAVLSVSPSGKIMVQTTVPGYLKCGVCSAIWCTHIRDIIQRGEDASSMWEEFHSEQWDLVSIPLVPTDSIHIVTILEPISEEIDYALSVSVHLPGDTPSKLSPFLGHINEGEGRSVIREMIIDWFEPEVEKPQEKCLSHRHDRSRDYHLYKHLNGNYNKRYSNQWTLHFFRLCMKCYQDEMDEIGKAPHTTRVVPDVADPSRPRYFDPDLIPK